MTTVLPAPGADKVIWTADGHPTAPLPAVRPVVTPSSGHAPAISPDAPWGAAVAFLTLDGRARRYLERHPGCGPAGCRRCARASQRCSDCRVATWALAALEMRPSLASREPK